MGLEIPTPDVDNFASFRRSLPEVFTMWGNAMAQHYFPGDCVLALTDRPSLALSLTFDHGARWRITVFDLQEKRAALTDQFERSLDAAKRYVMDYVRTKYGLDASKLTWREVRTVRGEGAGG